VRHGHRISYEYITSWTEMASCTDSFPRTHALCAREQVRMVVEQWRRIAGVEDGVRMGVRTVASGVLCIRPVGLSSPLTFASPAI
jgi:hypothetical protein